MLSIGQGGKTAARNICCIESVADSISALGLDIPRHGHSCFVLAAAFAA